MSDGAPGLAAAGFGDLSGPRTARRIHAGRWSAAVVIVAVLAPLVRAFAQGQMTDDLEIRKT